MKSPRRPLRQPPVDMKPRVRPSDPPLRRFSVKKTLQLKAASDPALLSIFEYLSDSVPTRTASLFYTDKLTRNANATSMTLASLESLGLSRRYKV